MARVLLALGVLVVTNLATFGWATWRCSQEAQGNERLLADSSGRAQALEREVADLQQQLDRLAVWREFVELQRDVATVGVAIDRLNFGDAITAVERVEARLGRGEYGETFQQRRAELLPALYEAKEALRSTRPEARAHLADLEQKAFHVLAATTELPAGARRPAPLATPSALTAPTPAPTPADAGPLPSPTPAPSPSPSPSPTPRSPA